MTHPPQPPFEGLVALPRGRRPVLRWTIAAIVLLLIIVPAIATRLADWLWYQDIGFERVFLTKIIAQWVLGLAAGVGGFILLYVNARIALRGVPTRNLHIRDANAWAQAGPKVLIERMAVWFVLPVTTLLALILALNSAGNWRDLAMYFYRTPFGVVDPIFGRDVAYYVFTIPMVENVLAFANVILWMALIMALPIYLVRTDVGIASGLRGQQLDVKQLRFYVTPRAQMHLAILGAALLVVSALGTLLVDVPSLLLQQRTVLFGASYTDLHVRLPLMRVLAALFVAAAAALIWYARSGRVLRGAIIAVLTVFLGNIAFSEFIPGLY